MVVSCLWFFCFPSLVFAERPTQDGKLVLSGNLHTHSPLSDDPPQELADEISPKQAFEYTTQLGLDFLAIIHHHKGVSSLRWTNIRTPLAILGLTAKEMILTIQPLPLLFGL